MMARFLWFLDPPLINLKPSKLDPLTKLSGSDPCMEFKLRFFQFRNKFETLYSGKETFLLRTKTYVNLETTDNFNFRCFEINPLVSRNLRDSTVLTCIVILPVQS